MTAMRHLWTLVQVSRPGLYHLTASGYLLPGLGDPWSVATWNGLIGLFFVVFPLNVLVYSMNDLKDVDIDKLNPRKGGLHGARASASELRLCMGFSVAACFVCLPIITGDFMWSLKWNVTCVLVNGVYNFGPQLSRVAWLDLLPPLGYLGTIALGCKMLDRPYLAPWVWCYIAFMIIRTQLWLQRMDIDADAKLGKRTTAVYAGSRATVVAILANFVAEAIAAHVGGCFPGQLWCFWSFGVLMLELFTGITQITMVLMFLGGLGVCVPFCQCQLFATV
eukprot:TRINITY_DN48326_c0_g1_i1.p1 TRINITY_DN48326_c0_g1~~TRINITY_DN48326_c0_g1_i1.p1  ORF type:complete len:278 (-),score=21.36 TRINITY_DN48326_c0_g1_i1:270-1103(-)